MIVATITMLARRGPDPTYAPLFDGASFSSAELIQMTAAFRKASLKNSRIDGRRIFVPRDAVEDYLVALHKADALPGDFDDAPTETPSFNPFATREHIQRSQLEADKRKLERILSGMSGIETASVQYTHVKQPGFPPTEETRAVVAVRMVDGRHLRLDEVETLRSTAVAYVAGLDRVDITITDLNAFQAYPGDDIGLADNCAVAANARMWEADLQGKIERQLSMIPDAIVGVTAHFDESSSETAPTSERGITPRPVLVTASIGIPDTYHDHIWRQRRPDTEGEPNIADLHSIEREVVQSIQRSVLAILPPPAIGWESDKRVEVTTYTVLASTDDGESHSSVSPWTSSTSFVGLLLALATATTAWWMLARRGTSPSRIASPTPQVASEMSTPPTEPHAPAVPNLQNELQQAIEKDPDAAAKLLGQWLRDAA